MISCYYFMLCAENVYVYRTFADPSITRDFKHFISTSRRQYIQLEVQACSDVWLALTAGPVGCSLINIHINVSQLIISKIKLSD